MKYLCPLEISITMLSPPLCVSMKNKKKLRIRWLGDFIVQKESKKESPETAFLCPMMVLLCEGDCVAFTGKADGQGRPSLFKGHVQ